MSFVSGITSTQLPTSASRIKNTAQQTLAAVQPAPAANPSSATISQAGKDLVAIENKIIPYPDDPRAAQAFMQNMAEKLAGNNKARAMYANDASNPVYAKLLDEAAQQNFTFGSDGVAVDLSWGKTSANLSKMEDHVHYTGGELVTPESQAYQQKQVNSYRNAATQLYQSEKAKGTPAGEIWIKIMDLQEQQPARFRAMMGWPNAADFAASK